MRTRTIGLFRTLIIAAGLFSSARGLQAAPVELLNFQISGVAGFTTAATSVFVHLAWTPSISFGNIGIRGEAGLTAYALNGPARTIATNMDVFFQFSLFPTWSLEIGGGLHVWGGLPPEFAISGNVFFSGIPKISRILAGYTRYNQAGGVNVFRVGLAFNF